VKHQQPKKEPLIETIAGAASLFAIIAYGLGFDVIGVGLSALVEVLL
jgi:hypothetical protein